MQISSMVKGFTAQFTNRVSRTGLRFLPALSTSAKSIFTMMGNIMKKRQTAMGTETTGAPPTETAMPSRLLANPGAAFPRRMPPTMERTTQRVRYRSKNPRPCDDFSLDSRLMTSFPIPPRPIRRRSAGREPPPQRRRPSR